MKRFVISGLVAGIVALGVAVNAEEAAPAAPAAPAEKAVKKQKAPMPSAVELTVVGTLKKQEKTVTDKKTGKEVTRVNYGIVKEDGGIVALPTPRAKKGEAAPAINLDSLLDKKVKVVGKGHEIADKSGAKKTAIKEITSIEEVQ